ncbi:MCE family protein [Actinocatenispora rupis]|uniref:ABC transporter substrate-binding protein n=1 Tax=Actinocatenispora rupis TaxID=519421 RepID=A0A8J3NC71_9ACTN|nr:MCE family protein [Actinocatenispora rupis]GID11570.1 ABC transporter substrate-binding protein [Actinocatenispora rupis]
MIPRGVKLKCLAFVLVSVLGVAYVAVRYVGVGASLVGSTYQLSADFASAGGIFTNASVTYRGSPVGKVTAVDLTAHGVRVGMRIDRGVKIPRDLRAVVADRSAVGEQYLDLRPNTAAGPYLAAGDTIPQSRTGTPLPTETLLVNLDKLIASVDTKDLQVVIDELGQAFEGSEDSLQRIIDSSDKLLLSANANLPQTVRLLQDGQTVLTTQQASSAEIRRWARGLAQLTTTVRTSDADLRKVLANAPPAARQVADLIRGVDPSVGTLLGNLITVGGVATRRLPGIKQILVVYPLVTAGGFTVTPGDGTAHFGLVLDVDDPPPCQYIRTGETRKCTAAEQSQGSSVRGTNNAPRPSGPEITPVPEGGGSLPAAGSSAGSGSTQQKAGANLAGYDPTTGLVLGPDGEPLQFGGTGGQYQLAGDQSWKQLLLAGLEP